MTIKAIETEYNGYRFRSRLEARWAVFFDALGVEYEYEPEGYELPSGKKYLPDFRVKCYGTRGSIVDPTDYRFFGLCSVCDFGGGDSYAYEGDCTNDSLPIGDDFADFCESDPDANGKCIKCLGYRCSYPFDLFIEVKGRMTQDDADRIREFATDNPVLIVGNIPEEGFAVDGLPSYELMNGIDIYQFNYDTIDGDVFAAYPAASDGHFYLMGDDTNYINNWDVKIVEAAYKVARQMRFEYGENKKVLPVECSRRRSYR